MTISADNIREHRRFVLKLTQAKVAKAARCSQDSISQLERGRLPKPWRLPKYLRAYNLDEGEFIRLVAASEPQEERD